MPAIPFSLPNNYQALTGASFGATDLVDALKRGFEAGNKPSKLSQDLLAATLANKINAVKAQYAPEEEQSYIENLRAQTASNKFKSQYPLLGLTGPASQIGALLYLKEHPELGGSNQNGNDSLNNPAFVNQGNQENQVGQGNQGRQEQNLNPYDLLRQSIYASMQPKNKVFAPSNTIKNLDALRDAKAGFMPNTNRTQKFNDKQEQEDYVAALSEKVTGLKSGEHYVYDPETHDKIGVERPTTKEEQRTIEGRSIFNYVMPHIRAAEEFSGKGSIIRFDRYAAKYGVDPEATQKIDDLLLALRLLSAGVVNESATLNAGKQLAVFKSLKDSLLSMDIPERIKNAELGLRVPNTAFIKASLRAQQILTDVTENAAKSVPATTTHYFHPEKYLKGKKSEYEPDSNVKAVKAGPSNASNTAPINSVGLYRNGKLYYIPSDKVDAALAKGFTYE